MYEDPYALIKEARRLLKAETEESTRSPKTEADYATMAMRLIGEHDSPAEVIKKAGNTQFATTWFKRRASLKFEAKKKMKAALSEQDKIQRLMAGNQNDNALYVKWEKWLDELDFYTELLTAIPTGCPIPPEKKRRRHSKKQDLKGLPENWRERLIDEMSAGIYALPLLVASLTGCRPEELRRGIQLRIDDGHLVAEIEGAKVKTNQGQPMRTLSWQLPGNSLIERLAKQVRESGNELCVSIDDPRNFSTAVRSAAKILWPKHKANVTPYCLRHALSADLKSAGVPREEVAAGMGHISDETCQHYGSANQSKGQLVTPDRITASRKVLQKYRHDPPRKLCRPKIG